jgi:hypothetical protein
LYQGLALAMPQTARPSPEKQSTQRSRDQSLSLSGADRSRSFTVSVTLREFGCMLLIPDKFRTSQFHSPFLRVW